MHIHRIRHTARLVAFSSDGIKADVWVHQSLNSPQQLPSRDGRLTSLAFSLASADIIHFIMPFSFNYVDIALASATIYFLKRVLLPVRQPLSLPPGPKGLPLVGNVADMPTQHEWKTFAEWARKYGE
jgi:hypothetical protein